ncbi:hypothetical protein ABZ078_12975 [Streptomyces sp. NPDC006385]|uniref:hypothetical protein n=1 Tax=Streptomyces sp. NPDC006385 TaxID=3156761 RepID=UPI0033B751F6
MTSPTPAAFPAAPDPSGSQAPADPVATGSVDAVADLRATARWTVAAAAGVGALLLGAGPLAAVGKVDGWPDALTAFGGLTLAMLGVGWAIWQTGEALTPCLATLADLDAPGMAGLRAAVARNPSAFYGPYASLDDLCARHLTHERIASDLAVKLAREQDPARARVLEQGLADARANAEQARMLQQRLLALIHAWSVRNAVRRARLHTLAAFVVVAVGAVLFLTATSDGSPARPAKSAPASSTQSSSTQVSSFSDSWAPTSR